MTKCGMCLHLLDISKDYFIGIIEYTCRGNPADGIDDKFCSWKCASEWTAGIAEDASAEAQRV